MHACVCVCVCSKHSITTFSTLIGLLFCISHSDRFQREREEALRDFKTGRSRVLVATSVAARGLDIPKVKHVVNYDLPQNIDEYVHRIGRTGRIGNKGLATAFFQQDKDQNLARSLVKVLSDVRELTGPYLGGLGGDNLGVMFHVFTVPVVTESYLVSP